jgi:hypothetical protein
VNSPLRSCPSVGAPSGAMLLPYFKGAKGFHSPPATESLFFAWPKKSNQKKGHPTLAPYAQSLCSRCARLLRGSLTVHPWTDIELAHIVWAILRTTPAQPRRDRGDPLSAHRARQSESALIRLRHLLPMHGRRKIRDEGTRTREFLLSLLRRMRSDRAPYVAAKWWRNCPKGGSHGCEPVGCQSKDGLSANPGAASRSLRTGGPETAISGWPSLWSLSLGHARESDSLAGRRVKIRHGCRAPKDDCMDAGGTTPWTGEVERRLEQPSRATQDDCMDAGGRATLGAVAEQLPSVLRIRKEHCATACPEAAKNGDYVRKKERDKSSSSQKTIPPNPSHRRRWQHARHHPRRPMPGTSHRY